MGGHDPEAELEQRFGYGLHELARRFDRSVSGVSRWLALAELLPEPFSSRSVKARSWRKWR